MSHYLKLKSVIETTRTDTVNGLSSIDAKERLSRDGANVLIGKKKKTLIRRFFEQFKDTMVIILLFAAFLSLVIAIYNHTSGANTSDLVEDYLEPVIIMIIVILNAVLGTVQEAKAEKSLEALQKLSAPHVRVLRDGQVSTVEAAQLVVGDIILIEAGDIVSADAR
ncbi:MAG TPA: cation-transporting P-type ATPase, partial [Eubacteriales bacterium]|nr:cation-transporting P-type ATPase [Eubacteriales bacterium]